VDEAATLGGWNPLANIDMNVMAHNWFKIHLVGLPDLALEVEPKNVAWKTVNVHVIGRQTLATEQAWNTKASNLQKSAAIAGGDVPANFDYGQCSFVVKHWLPCVRTMTASFGNVSFNLSFFLDIIAPLATRKAG
jgi:hypothetical protein